ncbi:MULTISPECIES: hypothetical protein [Actinomycetaceae]|uniref:hypothetical protein n=1 Tax=Actinomycetaceae TaxID=2049 RepID=UPI000445C8BE|nr:MULTISPECIES: hypothetical protein [Actinomycetaceae]EWC95129.1 hypothetical protein HMPREF1522_1419 [Actinomyces sp. ICM54]MCQ5273219.1 hypothetical protein [Schaalia odontolytica]MCQ5281997.1 hypothetical protein [Schaalia odontolytica]
MSNPENSSPERPDSEQMIRVVFIVALIAIVFLMVYSMAELGRLRTSSFTLGICATFFGRQLPGSARRIFATTPALLRIERIGLVCAGLCVVTAMVSAFVPLTDDLTAYRHSMMTTSVLAIVTMVIFFYLRRKAR